MNIPKAAPGVKPDAGKTGTTPSRAREDAASSQPAKQSSVPDVPTDDLPIDPVMDLLGGGRIVAFRVDLALAVGSTTAGLLLSQFWFWTSSPTSEKREGWFWMKAEEISEQTGLSREEQMTARKRLRALGVLEEDKRGMPMKQWFRVNKAKLISLLRGYIEAKSHLEAMPKDDDSHLKAIPIDGNAQTYLEAMPKDIVGQYRKIAKGFPQTLIEGMPKDITNTSSENSSSNSLENSSEVPEPPINPPGDTGVVATPGSEPDALAALWQMTLPLLADKVNRPTYETHLRFLMPVGLDDSSDPVVVTLAAPNNFTREWIERRQFALVQSALADVLGCEVTLKFTLAPKEARDA